MTLKKDTETQHPIEKLIWVMARLRDKNSGCPWDLEQDFKSIAPYTIEEAYEVADAIDRGNMKDLREELGDLLLQPIYHAQMAAEDSLFTIEEVITDITEKMISRHPHVFGDADANSAEDVNTIWEERKKAEKGEREQSAIDGITKGLPALLRAQKLQEKAAKTGFEWPDSSYALNKVEEELSELREALINGNKADQQEELGDLLFAVANLARMKGIKPETALKDANNKFEKRFKGIESDLKTKGTELPNAPLEQMMKAWEAQKTKNAK